MKRLTQEANSCLIARFMELKETIIIGGLRFLKDGYWIIPDRMKYHSSWDWLMPVIEKISGLSIKYKNVDEYFSPFTQTFGMKNEEGLFMFRFHVGFLHCHETLIGAAYAAVVEFLEGELSEKGVVKS